MARPVNLEFRVYLEGVLLPCQPVSITLRSAVNEASSGAIALPPMPHELLAQIPPRAHILLFFRHGDKRDDWQLLFEGEVHGYTMTADAHGATSSDLLVDSLDNYWASTYALHFQGAQSLATSSLFDAKLVFGSDGGTFSILNENGQSPVPLESVVKAVVGDSEVGFPELFLRLLRHIPRLSEFFRLADNRLRFVDRVACVPDAEIEELIKAGHAMELANDVFQHYPQDARLLTILRAMMEPVYYTMNSLVVPAFANRKITQFILMPDVPWVPAPRCNVLFPTKVSAMSFRRTFMDEPTRIRLSLLPIHGTDGALQLHYYAPKQMKAVAEAVKQEQGSVTVDGLLMKDKGLRPESREDIKGVIPKLESLSAHRALADGMQDEDERDAFYSQLATYDLFMSQMRPRILSVQGPFNPYVVSGFAGVLLVPGSILRGNVTSVTHTIHAAGAAQTSVTMDTCQGEDAPDPPTIRWLNKRFSTLSMIDSTYATLLGDGHGSVMASMMGADVGTISSERSQIAAAKRLIKAYDSSVSKERFETEYSKRPLVTFDRYRAAVGASESGQDLTGGPFRPEVVSVAQRVAQAYRSVVQDRT